MGETNGKAEIITRVDWHGGAILSNLSPKASQAIYSFGELKRFLIIFLITKSLKLNNDGVMRTTLL